MCKPNEGKRRKNEKIICWEVVGKIHIFVTANISQMATTRLLIKGAKRERVPVYVRLSAGRGVDLFVKSGFTVKPDEWSNKRQGLKRQIKSDEDIKFEKQLRTLKELIETEVSRHTKEFSREWLERIITKFRTQKEPEAKTLNDFITKFIDDVEAGRVKNRSGRNVTIGTARALRGFQRIFNEYQGIYTSKRIEELDKNGTEKRRKHVLDFDDITIDFYISFKNFLTDEGYTPNTIGRFIKQLKYFMSKSLAEKKHTNRQFLENAFTSMSEDSFSVSLTPEEVDQIYTYDLSLDERMATARDKFIVLCETALRVSDYDKIDVNIRTVNGTPLIFINQTKTTDPVIIPLTQRMEDLLTKYSGQLPRIHENAVNKYIKSICFNCGMKDVLHWEATKYGKRYQKSEPKWKLITCHTGRRTAASNMYRSGIPTLDIMRLTGHKSEREFLKYIRIPNEEVALKMAQHPYFSGTSLKVAK